MSLKLNKTIIKQITEMQDERRNNKMGIYQPPSEFRRDTETQRIATEK